MKIVATFSLLFIEILFCTGQLVYGFSPQEDAGLSRHEWEQCVSFIAKEARYSFDRGKLYIAPGAHLPCPIEKNQTTGAIFIHLKGRKGALLGRGSFKVVTKSILYGKKPIIVARCEVKQSGEFEADALKRMKGLQGVVQCYSYFKRSARSSEMILKYYNFGSLQKVQKGELRIPPSNILSMMHDLILGLQGMHERGYFHGDIKPLNVFLHKENGTIRAVLGDLGFAWKYERISPESFRIWMFGGDEQILSSVEVGCKRDKDIFKLGLMLSLMLFPEKYKKELTPAHLSPEVLNSVSGLERDLADLAMYMMQAGLREGVTLEYAFQMAENIAQKWKVFSV